VCTRKESLYTLWLRASYYFCPFCAIRGGLRSVSGIQRDDIRPVIEYLNAHAYLYNLGEAKR